MSGGNIGVRKEEKGEKKEDHLNLVRIKNNHHQDYWEGLGCSVCCAGCAGVFWIPNLLSSIKT